MTCLDLFGERHFAQKHRNVKYCTLIPRIRAFNLINHAITVLVKKRRKKQSLRNTALSALSFPTFLSLIVAKAVIATHRVSAFECNSFFIRRSRFIDPLDFMVRKLLPDPVY